MQDKPLASNCEIKLMEPCELDFVWPHLEDDLKKSFLGDTAYTTDDIKNGCDGGIMQLWIAYVEGQYAAFCVTQIHGSPRQKTGVFMWCGGKKLSKWASLGFSTIEGWLKEQGCANVSTIGRKGWGRLFKYDEVFIHYSKKL